MLKFFRRKFSKHKHKIDEPRPSQRIDSLYKVLVTLQARRNGYHQLPTVPKRVSSLQPRHNYKTGFISFLNTRSSAPPIPKRVSSLQYNKNTQDRPDYKAGFINFLKT